MVILAASMVVGQSGTVVVFPGVEQGGEGKEMRLRRPVVVGRRS